MSLRPLVLLDIVDQHFEPAVDPAMIEVESEAPNLERFPAAFVLTGVDAGIELLQGLVTASKQGPIEDFGITKVQGGLNRLSTDYDALLLGFDFGELQIEDGGGGNRHLPPHRRQPWGI